MYQDKNFLHYSDLYKLCDSEILDLINSRKLYCCLYNDSILEDEKKYYKTKIDALDSKIDLMCTSQNLIFKYCLYQHNN